MPLIVSKYPQLTEGYICPLNEVHPSNRHALRCALACLALKMAFQGDKQVVDALDSVIQGRAGMTKRNGIVTIEPLP